MWTSTLAHRFGVCHFPPVTFCLATVNINLQICHLHHGRLPKATPRCPRAFCWMLTPLWKLLAPSLWAFSAFHIAQRFSGRELLPFSLTSKTDEVGLEGEAVWHTQGLPFSPNKQCKYLICSFPSGPGNESLSGRFIMSLKNNPLKVSNYQLSSCSWNLRWIQFRLG